MEIINLDQTPSLAGIYLREMRDTSIQGDPVRFRLNLRRVGEIIAYEISKRLPYNKIEVTTPLAPSPAVELAVPVVLATILRAGLPFHEGFLSFFDRAENAFVSAYRKYKEKGDKFDVMIEYLASPDITGKTLILIDPMLATGSSMELAYKALLTKGEPAEIHLASVIASREAVEYIRKVMPEDKTTVWIGAVDPDLNPHRYIVPGLGDAGDLAYGEKL